ncbi:shikimate kinase [Mucilaginibacter sp. NFX135]|uniref:shikimate kinase n=1 Tax=Mucilaginibacter sp. NFX135 TaxID=3402687 RepID=UPI003AFB3196
MKIHIMGASCAGSTTLGAALAQQLNYPLFDSDKYFWETTEQPFTVRRDPELRNAMMMHDVNSNSNWILTGSMVSWGPVWLDMFDLVVFLYIPHHIRMQRLHNRELERYGEAIFTDPERAANYQAFIKWAKGYDDNTTQGRTLQVHENWLKLVNSPVLEIRGDTTVQQRVDLVLEKMKELYNIAHPPAGRK